LKIEAAASYEMLMPHSYAKWCFFIEGHNFEYALLHCISHKYILGTLKQRCHIQI